MLRTLRNILLVVGAIALLWRMLSRLAAVERAAQAAGPAPAPVDVPPPPSASALDDRDESAPADAGQPPLEPSSQTEVAPPAMLAPTPAEAAPSTIEADVRNALADAEALSSERVADAAVELAVDAVPIDQVVTTRAARTEAMEAEARALLRDLNRALAVSEREAAAAVATPERDETHQSVGGPFSLSGEALRVGQVVIHRVDFPQPLAHAVNAGPAGDLAASRHTVALEVERANNVDASSLAVVYAPGMAPTADGFSVRVTCSAAGPYSVTGRFRMANP